MVIARSPIFRGFQKRGIDVNDPSLVLYLPLADADMASSPFLSKDLNRYTATVTGAIWGQYGRILDGDDYIEVTGTALNFTASDFTILMWLYPTTLLGDSRLLFCRGVYQTDGYRFYMAGDGRTFLETDQAGAEQTSNAPVGSVVINQWQLVGVTRAGAVVKLWVDAVDKTTVSASHTNPLTSARTLKIGVADDTTNDFYIGKIGEVAAWSADKGQAGITEYWNSTKGRYGF